jgi:CPA2 family monovalent cation:H+ antiporter-2
LLTGHALERSGSHPGPLGAAVFAVAVCRRLSIPPILGYLVVGVVLGETEYRHQIEADIRPFRDVLLGLFFISVGMLLDVRAVAAVWPWVLAVGVV